ncbi:MAG: hypothetical protein IAE79_08795 [Anaerolinea sp.]|nr:hypothetical protein [Anaerolinea sp.]
MYGTQAQVVWEAMIGERETLYTEPAEVAVQSQLAAQLRAYCHLDTLTMVEIHRARLAL